VPPGYTPAVLIDGKAITLRGAGMDKTIVNIDLKGQLVLHVKAAEGKPFRITGLAMKFVSIEPQLSAARASATARIRSTGTRNPTARRHATINAQFLGQLSQAATRDSQG
jgi:hypothetical protein